MIYVMKLSSKSFERMKNGEKSIEYRLNDEKRSKLKYGDTIIFENLDGLEEKLIMEVIELVPFDSFRSAFTEFIDIPNSDIGTDLEKAINAMYKYYSKDDEKKYGCLAIRLKNKSIADIVHEYTRLQIKSEELLLQLKALKDSEKIPQEYYGNFLLMISGIEQESKKSDGIVVFSEIHELLLNNEYYINYCLNMSADDVMELSTKYLGGDVPGVDNDFLNEMIDAAILSDIPENVWRMALNYDYRIEDKSKLEDYIIAKKDPWYIVEFITTEFIGTHINKLINGLIDTNNLKEISHLARHFKLCDNNDKYGKFIEKLENAIKAIDGGWDFYQKFLEE